MASQECPGDASTLWRRIKSGCSGEALRRISGITEGASVHADTTLSRIVMSDWFEGFVGLIILGNCATLGLEAEVFVGNMTDPRYTIFTIDSIFTMFFTLELLLRVLALGWRTYLFGGSGTSNSLDAMLVITTDIVWVLSAALETSSASSLVRSFTAFRSMRLMRLARVVHKVPFFREVWLLLRGLAKSMRILWWTTTVIFFLTYVFAVFGVVLISVDVKRAMADTSHDSTLTHEELEMLWACTGGVVPWMFTFVQVLTLDSWNSILRPLVRISPFSWVLFYSYIALAVIATLNLVTAIIVEDAFICSKIDEVEQNALQEKERIRIMDNLRSLFASLDGDGSGDISWEEFEHGFSEPAIRLQMERLDIREHELKSLFDLFDTGDGVLSLDEFFNGIQRARGVAMARETFQISKRVEQLSRIVQENTHVVKTLLQPSFTDFGSRTSVSGPYKFDAATPIDKDVSVTSTNLSNSILVQGKREVGVSIEPSANSSNEYSEAGGELGSGIQTKDQKRDVGSTVSTEDFVGETWHELITTLDSIRQTIHSHGASPLRRQADLRDLANSTNLLSSTAISAIVSSDEHRVEQSQTVSPPLCKGVVRVSQTTCSSLLEDNVVSESRSSDGKDC
eukprot:TRINITY_DN7487_c0_g3_i5.p1 TRINITY_DN7487_c0_g3~~TRINITY_DN7487_c0_g3_i5.p1  ORF type:complete len:625 (-),score=75.13 TRINITY_DN7487_c0_g3_i5:96-1970(-)